MTESKPLGVLHLDHTTSRGGAEFALLRMLRMPAPWHASLLLPRAADAGIYEELRTSGVTVRFVGPSQTHGASSGGAARLLTFAVGAVGQSFAVRGSREFRLSTVVHANTSRSAVYGAIACWLSRKPFVVHLRDMVDPKVMGTGGFSLFTRVALARATGIIANSHSTLASAQPFMRPGMLAVVIPSAAGIVKLDPSSDAGSAVHAIGMLARIDPWKGQDLLLRAFAAEFVGTDVRLRLAGEAAFGHEDYLEELHSTARELGVEGQVDFVGHVDDIPAFLSGVEVCVQASIRPEPLGQNVLQYLAAGRVVIATREGGPGEWIRDSQNGLLFEMGDVDSLRAALRRAVDDDALRTALAKAAPQTPGLLTDAEVSAAHLDFFERCAAGAAQVTA